MSSPTPTKYPNTGRRETGVAAALIPVNYNDEDDEDATCTSFNAPYADSDDDIGNNPMLHILCVMYTGATIIITDSVVILCWSRYPW